VVDARGVFASGVVEMGCGLGKTFVGGELVRRSGAPAVVVTQHTISVNQWVAHLSEQLGLADVLTLTTARRHGVGDALPAALVLTYTALTRASSALERHVAWLGAAREAAAASAAPPPPLPEDDSPLLLWLLQREAFGLLVLDEVHLAAAEHFQRACGLHARAVVGLSGSLVREDDRIDLLAASVGPILHRYHAARDATYEVIRVPLAPAAAERLRGVRARSRVDHGVRALNPHKVAVLRRVLARRPAAQRAIVFCDSRDATDALARATAGRFGPIHGGVSEADRQAIIADFVRSGDGVLVAARVCDAAVDFPDGCLVVQLHVASGSRQQEVQRSGRGSRGDGLVGAHVVHLVNQGTEEEGFVARRLEYVRAMYGERLTVRDEDATALVVADDDGAPLECLSVAFTVVRQTAPPKRRRPRLLRSA
jgi:superfamily II DNA or RNA helicase